MGHIFLSRFFLPSFFIFLTCVLNKGFVAEVKNPEHKASMYAHVWVYFLCMASFIISQM